MKTEKKKRGRKPVGRKRTNALMVMLSDEEYNHLMFACRKSGKTKSQIVQEGIDALYKLALYYTE